MTTSYNCEGNGEVHLDVLKAICGDSAGKSMIDLCSGFAPQTRQLGFKDKFYIDSVERNLGEENDSFLVRDIFEFTQLLFPIKVDVTFMLDSIEHFPKEKSLMLLDWMLKSSLTQIVFTPLGDYIIETTPTDNPDSHKSGWLPSEFEKMGWATIVFPNFHKLLGIGAFFSFNSKNLVYEFERIKNELKNKSWTK